MNTRKLKWLICSLIIMGNFLGMLDSTSVNLALYPIAEDLEITLPQVQWVVIAYMLVLTVLLPFFGKLGDLFPKNKVYGSGFLIFAIGALLCSGAHSFNVQNSRSHRCINHAG